MGKEHHWIDKKMKDVEWVESIAHYYPFLSKARRDLTEGRKRRIHSDNLYRLHPNERYQSSWLQIAGKITILGTTVQSMFEILDNLDKQKSIDSDKENFIRLSKKAKDLKIDITEELVIFLLETN